MKYFCLVFFLVPIIATAGISEHRAQGFHWYSMEREDTKTIKKPVVAPPAKPAMTPYEELLLKRRQTMNLLAETMLRPSVESAKAYMSAQREMAIRHQKFVQNWERALLINPELDHRLHFPTDNNAIATRNDEQKIMAENIIAESARRFGLIFVYQGKSLVAQKFVNVLLPFASQHSFALIPVSVDGVSMPELLETRHYSLASVAARLPVKPEYLPALFLVNLKTRELSPLSYGFIALSDLKMRFLDVATDFKRFSYEGLRTWG